MDPIRFRPERAAPWLAALAALLLIVLPAARLWPNATYILRSRELNRPGYAASFGSREVVAESAHFVVEAPRGYLSEAELADLLERAEASWRKLVVFLGLPGEDRRVTMRLNPEEGVPYCGTEDINFYALKAGHTSVVHELTHYLMGYPNGLAAEGLAILAEDRFGWGLSFPNMLRPVDAHMLSLMRKGERFVPLADLHRTSRIFQRADPARSRVRYLQAASFSRYLAHSYGVRKLLSAYRGGDYTAVYGRPLEALEQGWRKSLRAMLVVQSLGMFAGGLAVAGMFYRWIGGRRAWAAAALLGFLACFVWSYYLVYPILLPAGLLAALAVTGAAAFFSRRAGQAALWVLWTAVLLWTVLIPGMGAAIH